MFDIYLLLMVQQNRTKLHELFLSFLNSSNHVLTLFFLFPSPTAYVVIGLDGTGTAESLKMECNNSYSVIFNST